METLKSWILIGAGVLMIVCSRSLGIASMHIQSVGRKKKLPELPYRIIVIVVGGILIVVGFRELAAIWR
jgi:hypothetical protein